jgi:CBS domain-containing protein
MKEFDIITKRLEELNKRIAHKEEAKKYISFKENVLEFIKVGEIIEKPEIVDIHTSIDEVMEIMAEKNVPEVLVSMNEEIVGMITLSNLLGSLRERRHIVKLEALNIMEKVIKINKDDNLSKAILIMNVHNVPAVVVYKKDKMLGIVTKNGILNKLSKIIFTRREEKLNNVIETKVDQLLDLLHQGEISMQKLKKSLGIDEEKIEEWLNILEKQGMIKIERSPFGKIKVKYVR